MNISEIQQQLEKNRSRWYNNCSIFLFFVYIWVKGKNLSVMRIILFFNLHIDKVYMKITPHSGVAAKPQKKPFNTDIVKTLGFDSRRFGGIDL